LLGLASDPESDPIFRNHNLDMDVLYRSGETQQVRDDWYFVDFDQSHLFLQISTFVWRKFIQGVATYTPRLVSVNLKGNNLSFIFRLEDSGFDI